MRKNSISKKHIIDSTAKVINSVGLENATIDEVAKKAKIAKGSIYVYFKSKDDLLNEAVKFIAIEKVNSLKEVLKKFNTPIEKIEALLNANEFFAKKQPETLLMNYALLISSHKNIRTSSTVEYFKKYHELLTQIIQDGIDQKVIIAENAQLIALIIILVPDLVNILMSTDKNLVKLSDYKEVILNLIKKKL